MYKFTMKVNGRLYPGPHTPYYSILKEVDLSLTAIAEEETKRDSLKHFH